METIACTGTDVKAEDLKRLLEQKLRESLGGTEHFLALQLRPEMRGGLDLVEWLDKCHSLVVGAGKQMVIVTANDTQGQYIELSHPDQNLKFVASIDELKKTLSPAAEEPAVPGEEVGPGPQPATAVPSMARPLQARPRPAVDTSGEFSPVLSQTPLSIGSQVKLAGEYICLGCNTTRMWLKGEKLKNCTNHECIRPSSGWRLTCELF
jgi:hypothetical protein